MILNAPINIVPMLTHRVYQLTETLLLRKWSDEEISQDLQLIKEELGGSLANLTTFDVYESELRSGHLEWSPPHQSDAFWKQNAQKLNENEYELLKLLCQVLKESEDPIVLSVACSDVGQYVKFYPMGKKNIQLLGGKALVMQLMTHEHKDVRYQALLAVQKFMTNAWEF